MKYKKRLFYIENVSAERIAKKFGTPSYVYSYDGIKSNINNFKRNFKTIDPLICFSVKSNSHLKILNLVSKFGLGADVVSKGELSRALNAKIKPEKIVFSGVGKTVDELKFAIKSGGDPIFIYSYGQAQTIQDWKEKLTLPIYRKF